MPQFVGQEIIAGLILDTMGIIFLLIAVIFFYVLSKYNTRQHDT